MASYNGLEKYTDSAGVDNIDIYTNGLALGVYLIYFVFTLVIIRQVDKCGVFDELVDRLAKSAEIQYLIQKHEMEARKMMEREARGARAPAPSVAHSLLESNEYHSDIDDSIHHMEEATARFPEQGGEEGENYDAGFLFELSNPIRPHVYFNTRANLGPSICRCCRSCCCRSSWLTDFIFYILNNSQVLSMMGCCHDHPFSREERRMAYLLQQTLAFAISSVVTTMTFDTLEVEVQGTIIPLSDYHQKVLLNVFVISPFILAIYKVIFLMFSCPCLKTHCGWRCLLMLKHLLENFSQQIARAVCFLVGSLCILWVSVFEPDTSFNRLVTFALQVQVVSAILDILRCLLAFFPVCIELTFCGIPLINLGRWVKDMRISKAKRYGTKPPMNVTFLGISLTLCYWSFTKAKVAVAPAPPEPPMVRCAEEEGIFPRDSDNSAKRKEVGIMASSPSSSVHRFSFRRPTVITEEDARRLTDGKTRQEVTMLLLMLVRRVESRVSL